MIHDQINIETIEANLHKQFSRLETATFGMGCFWGHEARFGSLPGVIRTRVGYAGGTTEAPTYRNLGDHTETIEIDFNPEVLSYQKILQHFWQNHYPNRDNYKGRQYISLLYYHSESQMEAIQAIKREMEQALGEAIETEIQPYVRFTMAEERHQKYYFKGYPKALAQLQDLYPSPEILVNSTFAARLNGFVKGYGKRAEIIAEIEDWDIDPMYRELLVKRFMEMKW